MDLSQIINNIMREMCKKSKICNKKGILYT